MGRSYDTPKSYSFCWGVWWREDGACKVVCRKVSHFNPCVGFHVPSYFGLAFEFLFGPRDFFASAFSK
jgi:hypothetical protein